MKVTVDDLSEVLREELAAYSSEVEENVRKTVKSVANDTKKMIVQGSPKRTRRYYKGWKVSMSKKTEQPAAVIYNKDRYFLTHLLENPHRKRGGGTVRPKKHIEPAVKQAEKLLVSRLEQNLKS